MSETSVRRRRILLAKPGLDGHDRGVKVIALALRDAGFEIIYTGLRQSIDAIITAATQEAVDAVGFSILSGSHLPLCTEYSKKRADAGLGDTLWLVGGNIPHGDNAALAELGVDAVFPNGTPYPKIVDYLKDKLP